MREVRGNLWVFPAQWRCITTNGDVKGNGEAIMGRGCALQAKTRYPNLSRELGLRLIHMGNHPHAFQSYNIITVPVKHHWHEPASLELIRASLWTLVSFPPSMVASAALPRPGCVNGALSWDDVGPICRELLDDRFTIVSWG